MTWGQWDPVYPLKALLSSDLNKYRSIGDAGIAWLLSQQFKDGSWRGDHILQIPHTHIHEPGEITEWKLGSFGTGITVDDHNRIFTTVTVLNLLALFRTEYAH